MKQKLLIFGGAGLVGSKFLSLYSDKYNIDAPEIDELDILNHNQLASYVEKSEAEIIINYAAFTDVDKAEEQRGDKEGIVYKLNSLVVKDMCDLCKKLNKHYIHFSTDYVFNGEKSDRPYTEEDTPDPLSWYGETKYLAEKFIKESGILATIIRLSMPFSAHYELKSDIARFFLKQLQDNQEIVAIDNQFVTPIYVNDLATVLDVLIKNKATGIYHAVCNNYTTPFDFATLIAEKFGLNVNLIKSTKIEEYNKTRLAKRSKYGWMSVEKFENRFGKGILHSVEESINLFKQEIE